VENAIALSHFYMEAYHMAKKFKFDPWSERKKLYEEIDQKRWSKATNLGKGKGIPEGWTLCDIGPQNAYIELDEKAIRKIDDDIKGFWKDICSLITLKNLEYIFTNTKAYHDFLIRGALLYCGWLERYFLLFITPQLKKINKTLKEMLQKESIIQEPKEIGVGYITLNNVVSILEKDFFRIKKKTEAYFKTCLENELKKLLLGKKEIVPTTPERIAKKQREIEKEDFLCSPREWEVQTITEKKQLMHIFKTKVYTNLTPRQKIIYERLKQGQKQTEIAEDLGITDRTIRNEMKRVIKKI